MPCRTANDPSALNARAHQKLLDTFLSQCASRHDLRRPDHPRLVVAERTREQDACRFLAAADCYSWDQGISTCHPSARVRNSPDMACFVVSRQRLISRIRNPRRPQSIINTPHTRRFSAQVACSVMLEPLVGHTNYVLACPIDDLHLGQSLREKENQIDDSLTSNVCGSHCAPLLRRV